MNEFLGAGSSRPMKIYDFLFSKIYNVIRPARKIVVKAKGKVKREKNWKRRRSQRPKERKNAAGATLSHKKAGTKRQRKRSKNARLITKLFFGGTK